MRFYYLLDNYENAERLFVCVYPISFPSGSFASTMSRTDPLVMFSGTVTSRMSMLNSGASSTSVRDTVTKVVDSLPYLRPSISGSGLRASIWSLRVGEDSKSRGCWETSRLIIKRVLSHILELYVAMKYYLLIQGILHLKSK